MSIWQMIKEVIIKIFWPWFRDAVWPFVKEHLADIIEFVVSYYKDRMKEWANQRAEEREAEANRRASDEQQKAEAASSPGDAEKHQAVAAVWREVAEQMRRENEELRAKIDELAAVAHNEGKAKVTNLDIDLDVATKKPQLFLGGSTYSLPALPSGNTDSSSSNKPEARDGL